MTDSRMPNMRTEVAALEQPEQLKRDTQVLFSYGEFERTAQAALLSCENNREGEATSWFTEPCRKQSRWRLLSYIPCTYACTKGPSK
jgi:hypothetical protein